MTKDHGINEPCRYRGVLVELANAQKSGHGVPAYLRWVNRRFGRHIAAAAFLMRLTPDTLSAIGGILTLAGILIIGLCSQVLLSAILGSILLFVGYAFDSADGQLARLTRSGSPAGEWFDHVIDSARQPAFHIAIAASFARNADPGHWWIPPVAIAFSLVASVWFFSQVLAEQLSKQGHGSSGTRLTPTWVSLVKSPYDCSFGYFLVLLLPVNTWFAGIYLCWFVFTLTVATMSLARKYQTLKIQRPDPALI